jgi:hypothetical protein
LILLIVVKPPNETNDESGLTCTGNGLTPLNPAEGVDHGSSKIGLGIVELCPKGGMIDVHRWYWAFG